jgi:hypothetical protein
MEELGDQCKIVFVGLLKDHLDNRVVKGVQRRKITLIEYNAKCRYLKKLTCKGTSHQVFYLYEAPSPPVTPYSSPLTHCIRVYSILIPTGRGGELTREKVREALVHKAVCENTYMTDCISSL